MVVCYLVILFPGFVVFLVNTNFSLVMGHILQSIPTEKKEGVCPSENKRLTIDNVIQISQEGHHLLCRLTSLHLLTFDSIGGALHVRAHLFHLLATQIAQDGFFTIFQVVFLQILVHVPVTW